MKSMPLLLHCIKTISELLLQKDIYNFASFLVLSWLYFNLLSCLVIGTV